jgi:hypothetical protein
VSRGSLLAVRLTIGLTLMLIASTARAHTPGPDDVIGMIDAPASRQRLAVRGVTRDEKVPRLLVIRVGSGWATVPTGERTAAAEEWWALWRDAVPQGIVAVLDAETSASLVNFDPAGGARLVTPVRAEPQAPR